MASLPQRGAGLHRARRWSLPNWNCAKFATTPPNCSPRAAQPALWLLVFGQVFARTRAVPTGGLPYLDFMAPGILAQSVLFIAIFHGIAIIWERDLGLIQGLPGQSDPAHGAGAGQRYFGGRPRLIAGGHRLCIGAAARRQDKLASLGAGRSAEYRHPGRGLFFHPFPDHRLLGQDPGQRFMGIGQVLTMPLFFASNAIYPISMMPGWRKVVSHLNPLTYEVGTCGGL